VAKRAKTQPSVVFPEKRARDAARALLDAVNEYGFDNAVFAEEIRRGHRTLQQSAFRAMVECIIRWADDHDSDRCDMRNEETVHTCAELKVVLERRGLVFQDHAYLPLV
jgi:hypothetical protein